MGAFAVGQVVLAAFPYADLSHTKLRPALVVGLAEFNNIVLCQITSKPYTSKTAIKLGSSDFYYGNLNSVSFIRPDKLFTAETSVVQKPLGRINRLMMRKVKQRLADIFEL